MPAKYVTIEQRPTLLESCGQTNITLEITLTALSYFTSPLSAKIFKIHNTLPYWTRSSLEATELPSETVVGSWTVTISDRMVLSSGDGVLVIESLDDLPAGGSLTYTLEATITSLPPDFDQAFCNKVEFIYGLEIDSDTLCLSSSTSYDHDTSLVVSEENIWGNQASVDIQLSRRPQASKRPSTYTGRLSYSDVRWSDTAVNFNNKVKQVNVSDSDLTFTTNKMKAGEVATLNLMLTPLSPGTKKLTLESQNEECQIQQQVVGTFLVKLPEGSAVLDKVFPVGDNDLIVDQGSTFQQMYLFYNRSGYDFENIKVVVDFTYEKAELGVAYSSDPNYANPSAGTVLLDRTVSDITVVNRLIWKIPLVRSLRYEALTINSGTMADLGTYQMTAKATGEFIFDCTVPVLQVVVQPDPWGTAQ